MLVASGKGKQGAGTFFHVLMDGFAAAPLLLQGFPEDDHARLGQHAWAPVLSKYNQECIRLTTRP